MYYSLPPRSISKRKDDKMHHRRIHCYVGSEMLLGKIGGEKMCEVDPAVCEVGPDSANFGLGLTRTLNVIMMTTSWTDK